MNVYQVVFTRSSLSCQTFPTFREAPALTIRFATHSSRTVRLETISRFLSFHFILLRIWSCTFFLFSSSFTNRYLVGQCDQIDKQNQRSPDYTGIVTRTWFVVDKAHPLPVQHSQLKHRSDAIEIAAQETKEKPHAFFRGVAVAMREFFSSYLFSGISRITSSRNWPLFISDSAWLNRKRARDGERGGSGRWGVNESPEEWRYPAG